MQDFFASMINLNTEFAGDTAHRSVLKMTTVSEGKINVLLPDEIKFVFFPYKFLQRTQKTKFRLMFAIFPCELGISVISETH